MSLTTKDQLSLAVKSLKTLISFKADRDDLRVKLDKSEVSDEKALKIIAEMELVTPVAASDGSIYTDDKGVLFVL